MTDSQHHYSYGSGMSGCLYDYGPNFCEKKEDAIEEFLRLFDERLGIKEAQDLRDNLMNNGIHYFHNPLEAGAQYCEVNKQLGPCPESDD
jgi:hypothetical protein